jgi:hypothetical protein
MIGADPYTGWVKDALRLDDHAFILPGEDCGADAAVPSNVPQANLPGVFTVGDLRSGSVKRVASAVGEGSGVVQAIHARLASLRHAEARDPMIHPGPDVPRRSNRSHTVAAGSLCLLLTLLSTMESRADEGGMSLWLPGQYGSLAAVPQQPGWALAAIYYHTDVSAAGDVSTSRLITIGNVSSTAIVTFNGSLHAVGDVGFVVPSYVFATPVLDGQLALSMQVVVGSNNVRLDGILTTASGPITLTRQVSLDSSVTGFGDLYPKAELRWNSGVNNFITYLYGDIPVGAYERTRLANLGLGHAGIDGGGGYTYLDPTKGHEFSAVAGLTYNFVNPDTKYRSGVDFHLDWGASQFLSPKVQVGLVGYFYQQLTDDTGAAPILINFKSRVAAIGPQLGLVMPMGTMQGYLNLKGYSEFDAKKRPDGWNIWLTFAISPAAKPRP